MLPLLAGIKGPKLHYNLLCSAAQLNGNGLLQREKLRCFYTLYTALCKQMTSFLPVGVFFK